MSNRFLSKAAMAVFPALALLFPSAVLAGDGEGVAPAKDAPPAKEAAPKPEPILVDLGNAKCPIMGGPVDGTSFSEWNGLRIGHCCPGCTKGFLADPEARLAKAGIEWKEAAAAVKKAESATGEEREKAVAALAAKWTVVRGAAPAKTGLLVDLGNPKCPIMGGKADGATYSEWNGLRVSHCCKACVKRFMADPEAALAKAGIEWKEAAAAVRKVLESKGEARDAALKELRKKWTVLREAPPEAPAAK